MIRLLDLLRVALGLVMAITAFDYFMPALVPVVAQGEWTDPQAARLMSAFDRSGLLAVAKFIQLAGGALLVVNRSAPFALAAILPVNVCGTYIAVVLEGDPLHALAALALLALNGLLMLAYLPAYSGLLGAGHLADGEGAEPGQHYNSLFVNPFSGAPLTAYLGGALALGVALYAYWRVIPFANGTTGLYTLIFPTAVFVIGLVMAVRRGRSGAP